MIEFPTIPGDAPFTKDLDDCTASDLEYLIDIRKQLAERTGIEHDEGCQAESRVFQRMVDATRARGASVVRDLLPNTAHSSRRVRGGKSVWPLSRSVVDGAGLMERAAREGRALHFADLDIDTSTPAGEMAANIIISGSQYERRLISQRTRDALAAKRARGERLGAAPALPMEVTRRIIAERTNGRTFQAIAEGLMADGIPTARGKTRWYPATIKAVVTSDNAAALV